MCRCDAMRHDAGFKVCSLWVGLYMALPWLALAGSENKRRKIKSEIDYTIWY